MNLDEKAPYSDYIVYVDESGDHSLTSIDNDYPIFALAFCIFEKRDYASMASPGLQELKFKHFGHDMVVLHEHEIRKPRGDFSFLQIKDRRDAFMRDLNQLIEMTPFTIIASVIDKRSQKPSANSPYHLSLLYCLERLYAFLSSKQQADSETHVIVESRGKREDQDLESEFNRIKDGKNYKGHKMKLQLKFASKRSNSCGLQIADLVARPIGLSVLRPGQANRAFELLKPKLRKSPEGKIEGWGLKVWG